MRSEEVLKKTAEGMKEGNKILIQELMRDLEEKGIAPVISVDGKVRKLKLVCEREFKEFKKALAKFSLEKSDFCLLEEDVAKPAQNTEDQHLGSIFLIHKKSGKIHEYKADNDAIWIAELYGDLEKISDSNS